MAFPDDPLDVTIELAFGADRTADPASWSWTDVTDRWHLDEDLTVSAGRREGARQAEPGEIALVAKNQDGHLTPEDPRSPWWPHVDEGLPVRLTLDPGVGDPLVYGGFVASLKPRWPSGTGNQALVDVVAGGVIRLHGRGRSPLQSAPHRWISAQEPTVYWPLTDTPETATGRPAAGTGQLAPEQSEVEPPVDPFVEWRRGALGRWLDASLRLRPRRVGTTGTVFDRLVSSPLTIADDTVTVDLMLRRVDNKNTRLLFQLRGEDETGTNLLFRWYLGAIGPVSPLDVEAGVELEIFRTGDFVLESSFTELPQLMDQHPHHVRMQLSGQATLTVWVDGVEIDEISEASIEWQPQLRAELLWYASTVGDFDPGDLDVGYVAVWSGTPPSVADAVDAAFGHSGEAATTRAARLCTEEQVAFELIGDGAASTLMGRQVRRRFLDLLRECELAEDGILAEATFGYQFRDRASRYNQNPALTIDADQRQLGKAFEPVRDDQRPRNEWTVERAGGASVTVRDAEDQKKRGRREDSLGPVSLASDLQLDNRASWELARSLHRGLRYPHIEVPLHVAPALLEQVMALRLGDRMLVENPPRQHPPGPVDQVVEGMTHTVRGRRRWWWQAVVSPSAPWDVGMWQAAEAVPDPGEPARYDILPGAPGAALDSGVDTTATILPVDADADDRALGHGWTTEGDAMPFDVNVGGERVRVTAVTNETGRQDLTVTRSVNGVVKSHASGTEIRLWAPARWGL